MSPSSSQLKKALPGLLLVLKILPRPIQIIGVIAIIITLFVLQNSDSTSIPKSPTNPTPLPTLRQSTNSATTNQAQVIRVIDGDTLMVSQQNQEETVRLIGVNTPEVVDPRQPQQCYGQEASNKAKQLAEGQMITLESDPTQGDRDTYGRLLRYVFLANNINLSLQLIAEGYAFEYTYRFPYKYQAEFKSAQQQARQSEVGLWNPSTCNGKK